MNTPTTDPAAWTDLVEHHTRRLIAEGADPADARPKAQLFVDEHFYAQAWETDRQIGPRHHRDPDADKVACGQIAGTIGARAYALAVDQIGCDECLAEVDRRIAFGAADIPYGMGPADLLAARHRHAERYMASALDVPDWALPSGTEGTPLHALSLHVRSLAARRVRMAGRLDQALKTQQGKTERARGAITDGGLPSWDLLEPDPAVETAATAEGLRMLDRVLAETVPVLVAVCTQTNRWLKSEGVTGEPAGELRVIAAACDWRDLRLVPVAGRVHMDSVTALVDAVDTYRRTLRPVLDAPPVDPGPRCTHGGDCPVHPDVRGLHDLTPKAADAMREVLDAASAGPVGAAEVLRIADRLGVDIPGAAG